jgi:hypothetical protein
VSTLPKIGARVRVPWGLTTVEGEVVNAYDSGFGGQVGVDDNFVGDWPVA